MSKLIDLIGQRFGRLVVIERVENDKHRSTRWLCQCECGNKSIVRGIDLRSGNIKSCGCLKREKSKQRLFKHGGRYHRLYHIWKNMKSRCLNPRNNAYKNYGGRGITVCKEWRNSYEAFRDWAMANGYDDTLSVDRIDNNKGYCPENCRWATTYVQANNMRRNHFLAAFEKTQTIAEWAREMGLSSPTIRKRLSRGWSVEKALTTPVKKK